MGQVCQAEQRTDGPRISQPQPTLVPYKLWEGCGHESERAKELTLTHTCPPSQPQNAPHIPSETESRRAASCASCACASCACGSSPSGSLDPPLASAPELTAVSLDGAGRRKTLTSCTCISCPMALQKRACPLLWLVLRGIKTSSAGQLKSSGIQYN